MNIMNIEVSRDVGLSSWAHMLVIAIPQGGGALLGLSKRAYPTEAHLWGVVRLHMEPVILGDPVGQLELRNVQQVFPVLAVKNLQSSIIPFLRVQWAVLIEARELTEEQRSFLANIYLDAVDPQ